MRIDKLQTLAIAAGCAALLPSLATAQAGQDATFAAPVRIKAGEKHLGAGRLYPSPVSHDVDGDGTPDLVIGDLFGRVTWARGNGKSFAAEQPLKAANGKPLKFNNW